MVRTLTMPIGMSYVQMAFSPSVVLITQLSSTITSKYRLMLLTLFIFRLYVFGGNDIRFGPMNNLWCFDLSQIGDLADLCKYKNQSQDYPMGW